MGGMGIEKNGNWEEWTLGSGGTEEKVGREHANPQPAFQCSKLPVSMPDYTSDLNILCLVYNFIPNT